MRITVIVIIIIINFIFTPISFAGPSSTNFELKAYSFGAGGADNSTSTNFKLFGVAGEGDVTRPTSANFKSGNGLIYTQTANLPTAPTLTNPSNFYNKLTLTLNTGGNASDAQFAIAISTDNFVADTTHFVQTDDSVGTTLSWQTNSIWGFGGFNLIGLNPNTTYTVKVAAKKGNYTQTGFGPTAQAATIGPTMSFSLTTTSQPSPPFSVSIGTLTPQTVVTSSDKVNVNLSTNGNGGGMIYVYDSNAGLLSSSTSTTIAATSADLTGATSGYGLRGTTTSQSSGGPMRILAPYNGAGSNVGVADSSKRLVFDSTGAPVTTGVGSFELKAKASNTTPAATDYNDTLTILATGSF